MNSHFAQSGLDFPQFWVFEAIFEVHGQNVLNGVRFPPSVWIKIHPKTQNCGKNRPDWAKWLFIQVSVAPNRVESGEISQTASPFFYSVP